VSNPNPTGTVYLQADPNYVWADGDVYEIPQTDTIEGAASGASFGGLGVINQPHKALLNKINYLKRQLVQATSNVGQTGWYKFEDQDSNKGLITPIVQWGAVVQSGPVPPPQSNFFGPPPTGSLLATLTATFPISFTTTVWQFTMAFSLAPSFGGSFKAGKSYGGGNNGYQVIWPTGLTSASIALFGVGWEAYYGTFFWTATGY
jgi:hypothetical protein